MNNCEIRKRLSWTVILLLLSHALTSAFQLNVRVPLRSKLKSSSSFPSVVLWSEKRQNHNEQGEVGKGSNWIEKSFPVDTKINIKQVDDYNLGISGKDFQTGSLSKRMFETIVSRTSLEMSDEIKQAFMLYAMDFTAKEATRAALKQNGLVMVLQEEEEDQGMWGDVEAIRLYDITTDEPSSKFYDSLEEAVKDWRPGQNFDFVARQVSAKIKELSIEELVQALDPDGSLREESKERKGKEAAPNEEALLSIFDEGGVNSLADLANDCMERTQNAPKEATDEANVFAGSNSKGYHVIKRSDLLRDSIDSDGKENEKTTKHLMNALVSHGVLLVDLSDGGASMKDTQVMAEMWKTTEDFFTKASNRSVAQKLPGMKTITETGSRHAKVGYAESDTGSMRFLETRRNRINGTLLPVETFDILGEVGVNSLQSAFDIACQAGKDVVRIAVAAASVEHGAFISAHESDTIERDQKISASIGATLLSNELVDDGRLLGANCDIESNISDVSMSPHRLCSYSNPIDNHAFSWREVFGAHTDSTFVTIVPVAAISGLEVFDEEEGKWYRPELKARTHWESEQISRGKDPNLQYDELERPWHSRYLAVIPGEHLQLSTRDEIPAAVHRVVASKANFQRISAPILLRGRPGVKFQIERYLGGSMGNMLLEDADGLTMDDINDKCQPSSYQ